mgnify:FL=1
MKIFLNIFIRAIKLYKLVISPYIGNNCRYMPTCSDYFIESLKVHGLFKGIFKGTKRILSCHPIKFLGGGEGFDPVNKNVKAKK